MRTGTVRPAGARRSSLRMRRSDEAGGAATSDGASARGGAGMNDDGRGFSPACSQFATGPPLDVIRGRGRRARFLSSTTGAGRGAAATATGFGAGFGASFGCGFSTGFGRIFGAGAGLTAFGAVLTGGAGLTAFNAVFATGLGAGLRAGFVLAARAFGATGFFAAFPADAVFGRAAGRLAPRFATAVFFPCTFAIDLSAPKGSKNEWRS